MTEPRLETTLDQSTIKLSHVVRISVHDGPEFQEGRRIPERLQLVVLEYSYDFQENEWRGTKTAYGRRVKKDGSTYAESLQPMYIWHRDAGEEIRAVTSDLFEKHRPITKHTLTTEVA